MNDQYLPLISMAAALLINVAGIGYFAGTITQTIKTLTKEFKEFTDDRAYHIAQEHTDREREYAVFRQKFNAIYDVINPIAIKLAVIDAKCQMMHDPRETTHERETRERHGSA